MRASFWRFAVGVMSCALLITSCDQLVLGRGELDAKRRFEAVQAGQSEANLTAQLGPPTAVFTRQPDGTYATQSTSDDARTLARHLKGFREAKVLGYLDGSVHAYYEVDEKKVVTRRSVEVS